jgi:hypothetical protein
MENESANLLAGEKIHASTAFVHPADIYVMGRGRKSGASLHNVFQQANMDRSIGETLQVILHRMFKPPTVLATIISEFERFSIAPYLTPCTITPYVEPAVQTKTHCAGPSHSAVYVCAL